MAPDGNKTAVYAGMRDKGVSDAVWEQLERDKAAEVAKEEHFQRLQSTAREARDAARQLILEKIKKEENERKRKEAIQEYLRVNGVCPVGYYLIQQCNGFRCAYYFSLSTTSCASFRRDIDTS